MAKGMPDRDDEVGCRIGWHPRILAFCTTAALGLSVASTLDCQFMTVDLGFAPRGYPGDELGFGLWAYAAPDGRCLSFAESHGPSAAGGFSGLHPLYSNVVINDDTGWSVARILAIVGTVFGALSLALVSINVCKLDHPQLVDILAYSTISSFLCECSKFGLFLLNDLCRSPDYWYNNDSHEISGSRSCGIDRGAIMSITSIGAYLVTMIITVAFAARPKDDFTSEIVSLPSWMPSESGSKPPVATRPSGTVSVNRASSTTPPRRSIRPRRETHSSSQSSGHPPPICLDGTKYRRVTHPPSPRQRSVSQDRRPNRGSTHFTPRPPIPQGPGRRLPGMSRAAFGGSMQSGQTTVLGSIQSGQTTVRSSFHSRGTAGPSVRSSLHSRGTAGPSVRSNAHSKGTASFLSNGASLDVDEYGIHSPPPGIPPNGAPMPIIEDYGMETEGYGGYPHDLVDVPLPHGGQYPNPVPKNYPIPEEFPDPELAHHPHPELAHPPPPAAINPSRMYDESPMFDDCSQVTWDPGY